MNVEIRDGLTEVARQHVIEGELPAQNPEHELALGGDRAGQQARRVGAVAIDPGEGGGRLPARISAGVLRVQPSPR